jgi:hypothetical protein
LQAARKVISWRDLKIIMKRPEWAQARTAFDGKRYALACTWEGDGEIFSYDENRVIFKCRNKPSVKSQVYGFIKLPEFIVNREDNSEELRFQRTRRFLRTIFDIRTTEGSAGQIVQRNPICTGYEITLANGTKWNLSLPLFTIGFFGSSSNGGRLLFWLKSHRLWQAVVDTEHDSALLIASLAFIHRERLRHG